MNNNFSDNNIPALSDTQGFADYMNRQNMQELGIQNPITDSNPNPNTDTGNQANPNAGANQQDTQALIQQAVDAALARQQPANPAPTAPVMNSPYSADLQKQIVTALQMGYSLEQINNALTKMQGANAGNGAVERRISNVEQTLQNYQMQQEAAEFERGMYALGDKLGLTEDDLYTFGVTAMKNGIDIFKVKDVEAVFRGLYPDQYNVRIKRAQSQNSSQLYGGANMQYNAQDAQRQVDNYVDSFLRERMPGWYNKGGK